MVQPFISLFIKERSILVQLFTSHLPAQENVTEMPRYNKYPFTDEYSITCARREIDTTVTNDPRTIAQWVRDIQSRTYRRGLIVGLDCEWRPNRRGEDNPIATIQLCTGTKCLIVQLLYLTGSRYLRHFLKNRDITFVGVGIDKDAKKMFEDHRFVVGDCRYDLAEHAASNFNRNDFGRMGLKCLMSEILDLDLKKPKRITISDWSVKNLSFEQVEYACLDAYASFALGMALLRR